MAGIWHFHEVIIITGGSLCCIILQVAYDYLILGGRARLRIRDPYGTDRLLSYLSRQVIWWPCVESAVSVRIDGSIRSGWVNFVEAAIFVLLAGLRLSVA